MDRLSPVSNDSGFASNSSIEIPPKIFYDMSVPILIPDSMMSPPISEASRDETKPVETNSIKKDSECELEVASCSCLSYSQGSSEGAVPTISTESDNNDNISNSKVPEINDDKESESNRCCSRSSSISVRSSSRSREDIDESSWFPAGRKRTRTIIGEICYLNPSPSSSSFVSQSCSYELEELRSYECEETPVKKVKTPSESLPPPRFSFSPILFSCSWKECHLRYPSFNDVYDHVIQAHIRPFLDLPSSKPSSSRSPDASDDIVAECKWADCEMGMERGDRQKKYSWLCDHFRTRHAKMAQPFKCVITGCRERFKTTEKLEEHVRIDHINGNAIKKKEARERELMAGFLEWQPLPKPKCDQQPLYSRSLDQKVHKMILQAKEMNFEVKFEPRKRPGIGSAHRKMYATAEWEIKALYPEDSYEQEVFEELLSEPQKSAELLVEKGPSTSKIAPELTFGGNQDFKKNTKADPCITETKDSEDPETPEEDLDESDNSESEDDNNEESDDDTDSELESSEDQESGEDDVDDVSMNDLFPGWDFDSMKDQYFTQKEVEAAERTKTVRKQKSEDEIRQELASRMRAEMEAELIEESDKESDWDADEEMSDEEEEY